MWPQRRREDHHSARDYGAQQGHGGTLSYDGRNLLDLSPSKRVSEGISYVQEGKKIFRDLTVEQNLLLGGYSTRAGRRGLRPEVERIYELFPILEEKRALPAGSMSGGQQQMLAIGQALMAKPRLLILDEPSQGLAPVIVKEVMQQVHSLKSTGIGILLVEQDVADSMAIADEVSVVDMGRTVLSALVSEIKEDRKSVV